MAVERDAIFNAVFAALAVLNRWLAFQGLGKLD
jgi:hypothetical protein